MTDWSRRKFFLATLVGGAAASAQKTFGATTPRHTGAGSAADRNSLAKFRLRPASARGTRPLHRCAQTGFASR